MVTLEDMVVLKAHILCFGCDMKDGRAFYYVLQKGLKKGDIPLDTTSVIIYTTIYNSYLQMKTIDAHG